MLHRIDYGMGVWWTLCHSATPRIPWLPGTTIPLDSVLGDLAALR
ncbi:MAG: hypothetical protein JWM16_3744 [Verrucomicrobiales bacterium]|nr:hypothetical protein [Verrucomicrobiales bacterium]